MMGDPAAIPLRAEIQALLDLLATTYSEGSVTDSGTSLNILERQPGGSWLIRIPNLNADETA